MGFKYAFLLAMALLMNGVALGQSFTASYVYDNNGNRILATVIYFSEDLMNPREKNIDMTTDEENPCSVTVYPNPTQGVLMVELTGYDFNTMDPKSHIRMWDMAGKDIIKVQPLTEQNTIDLSAYGHGTYVMHLEINGVVKTFKIIKN